MPKRQKQNQFEGAEFTKPKDSFGGSLLTSHPKKARPLDSKLPIHLTLKSVSGGMRSFRTMRIIDAIIEKTCKKHGVKVFKYANVGNHLHLLLKLRNRRSWAAFIRELTGRIAHFMLEGKTGANFWAHRPFTRVVRGWQKAFKMMKAYIDLNTWEAEGHISRKETKTLKDLRQIFGEPSSA